VGLRGIIKKKGFFSKWGGGIGLTKAAQAKEGGGGEETDERKPALGAP